MRHGFLIMIHNNYKMVEKLITYLDREDTYIFIHVDKKSEFGSEDESAFRKCVSCAKLVFVERITVNWGGYSQIEAEMSLLRTATAYDLDYYHLLSGADLPLKNRAEMDRFFEENSGTQFVTYCSEKYQKSLQKRARYFWLFQETIGNPKIAIKNKDFRKMILLVIQRILVCAQILLGIDRRRKNPAVKFTVGANWFSITRAFAEYVVSQQAWIEKTFKDTICCDEVFLNTLLTNSPFNQRVANNQRLVDWNRGNPYTFRYGDLKAIMESNQIFARKFDPGTDPDVITAIYDLIDDEAQAGSK